MPLLILTLLVRDAYRLSSSRMWLHERAGGSARVYDVAELEDLWTSAFDAECPPPQAAHRGLAVDGALRPTR